VKNLELKQLGRRFYSGNYRYYIALPALLFVVFAFLAFVSPGIEQGIDLKGGTLLVIGTDETVDAQALESAILSQYSLTEMTIVPFQGGVQVQFGFNPVLESAKAAIADANTLRASNPGQALALCNGAISGLSAYLEPEQSSFESAEDCVAFARMFYEDASDTFEEDLDALIVSQIGAENVKAGGMRRTEISPALGRLFWSSAQIIMVIALVAVIIVIFIFFRAFVPSVAVVLAAAFDILAALGLMAVFHINFSLASISALLMLVGYSVDTDIMLTTRLTKRKFKTTRENAADCLVTGLTMTGTTLGAVMVMLFLSSLWNLEVIFSIAAVLMFGLIGDLISTWFMNAPILMLYVDRKKKRGK